MMWCAADAAISEQQSRQFFATAARTERPKFPQTQRESCTDVVFFALCESATASAVRGLRAFLSVLCRKRTPSGIKHGDESIWNAVSIVDTVVDRMRTALTFCNLRGRAASESRCFAPRKNVTGRFTNRRTRASPCSRPSDHVLAEQEGL